MANKTEKSYSIKDAALAMGISEATVKAYKATLIRAFEHCSDRVLTESRSLNECGLEQLKEVQKFHRIGAPDGYVALIREQYPLPANNLASDLASEPKEPLKVDFEVVSEDFIKPSQLATVSEKQIELPPGFDPSAMIRFFDGVVGETTDTKALLAIADLAINAVQGAFDQKISQQKAELAETESDASALEKRVETAKTDLKIKALESRLLAERQTAAKNDATAAFNELMSLGKPDSSTSQS